MKIVIVGGGPAGIAAALTISDSAEVVIIEKKDKLGGKIPLTGNGRCNLSNCDIDLNKYVSLSDIERLANVFSSFNNDTYTKLLMDCGIYTSIEEDRIYPLSFRADQVRDLLEARIRERNIEIITNAEVCDIAGKKDLLVTYKIDQANKQIKKSIICDKVILATGTPAGFKRPKDNNSLYLSKLCGFDTKEFESGLVPLICRSYDTKLAGVRCQARLRYRDIIEEGEVQFTDFGLSGIPAMQLSLAMNSSLKEAGCCVSIDFIPEFDDLSKRKWLESISHKQIDILTYTCGLVNKKIALHVLKISGIDCTKKCDKLSENEKNRLLKGLCEANFFITEKKDISFGQVCLGGIELNQLGKNLCRDDNNRIFAVGELLDVAGRCGGYNLFFAFASGYSVGMAINNE